MVSDVQGRKPDSTLPLARVGVKGLKFPAIIRRGNREIVLSATAEIFVDVPGDRKGADLSEITRSVSSLVLKNRDFEGIENITSQVCALVLDKLSYVTRCECTMQADYFVKSGSSDDFSLNVSTLIGETKITRSGEEQDFIGIIVQGINACPCTMEKERRLLKEKFPEFSGAIDALPIITHNQRNRVMIKVQNTKRKQVDADSLIAIAQSVIGQPVSIGVKGENDADLILRQHLKPMFVEDVVREIAKKLKEDIPAIDPESTVIIRSESEESVHPHNAFAEFSGKFKDI
ncbi:MAG: GTP cyclohydrolase MptA [Candidatus Thermoplasmatota archaeon]|nr:GTP cyclohydrolase MptA [Candidatus Thermoplasmatota archaeon]